MASTKLPSKISKLVKAWDAIGSVLATKNKINKCSVPKKAKWAVTGIILQWAFAPIFS
jgi:hypothetical protein